MLCFQGCFFKTVILFYYLFFLVIFPLFMNKFLSYISFLENYPFCPDFQMYLENRITCVVVTGFIQQGYVRKRKTTARISEFARERTGDSQSRNSGFGGIGNAHCLQVLPFPPQPTPIHTVKSNPQCDSIWKWSLWEVIRSIERRPHDGINALLRKDRTDRDFLTLFSTT